MKIQSLSQIQASILEPSLYFHESILLVLLIRHLEVMCTLDMPHDHQTLRILQHLLSRNIVQRYCFDESCICTQLDQLLFIRKIFHSFFVVLQKVALCLLIGGLSMSKKSVDSTIDSDCSITAKVFSALLNGVTNSSRKSVTAP